MKKDETIIVYKAVNKREDPIEMTFEDFLENPKKIYKVLRLPDDFSEQVLSIKDIKSKSIRNEKKREMLPAVDLSQTGILSIDIDGIAGNTHTILGIVSKLKNLKTCMAIQESVSGNLVAFFKYECSVAEYKFLYYKIYLELTLLLSVSIDFLPEIGRLRYVSNGELYHLNYESETLTEILDVDEVPYINTKMDKPDARRVVYGSN